MTQNILSFIFHGERKRKREREGDVRLTRQLLLRLVAEPPQRKEILLARGGGESVVKAFSSSQSLCSFSLTFSGLDLLLCPLCVLPLNHPLEWVHMHTIRI